MTDPKTRALELVEALAWAVPAGDERIVSLRLAITQIPTQSWQPIQTAPLLGENVKLLVQSKKGPPGTEAQKRRVALCSWHMGSWWESDRGTLSDYWTPLAWRPADPTDLPADWGTECPPPPTPSSSA